MLGVSYSCFALFSSSPPEPVLYAANLTSASARKKTEASASRNGVRSVQLQAAEMGIVNLDSIRLDRLSLVQVLYGFFLKG
jgi:hypothetical protein